MVISYSDGEGTDGCVGIAFWKKGDRDAIAGTICVPEELRELWDEQQRQSRHNDIFEVEVIGPLLLLHNFPEAFRDSLWLHFIDNAGGLACLINGSSTVMSGDVIVGETWEAVARLSSTPWFDRVESNPNPADGLSRGKLNGPWSHRPIQFPPGLLPLLRRELRNRGRARSLSA